MTKAAKELPIGYVVGMEDFSIIPCPVARQAEALRLLHDGLTTDQQSTLVHTLATIREQGESAFEGLLVAIQAEELMGVVWVQLAPGKTAVLWPPIATSLASADLMRAATHFLAERPITLAQFLVSDEGTLDPRLLEAGNFRKLARLAYLTAESGMLATDLDDISLEFRFRASDEPERLGELLLNTYEGSLDCPQLNGLREADDVLAGYQQQGVFAPERWFFVRHEEQDIGALILTSHANTGNWELAYMGLVPAARGKGWGRQVLRFAMREAGLAGAERLVLAVDEANQPALRMYQRAGFVAWDHRTAYAWLRERK